MECHNSNWSQKLTASQTLLPSFPARLPLFKYVFKCDVITYKYVEVNSHSRRKMSKKKKIMFVTGQLVEV